MNKNSLIYGFIFAVFSIIFAGWVIYKSSAGYGHDSVGDLLLPESYAQALDIDKIVIKNPARSITLRLKDNFWHVEEASGYYAGLIITNSLLISFNEAEIKGQPLLSKTEYAEAQLGNPELNEINSGNLIQTYNKNGALIESVIIGAEHNGLQYARRPDSDTVWLVSGKFDLPAKVYAWLQQPLIMLNIDGVEALSITSSDKEQSIQKNENSREFYNAAGERVNPYPLLEAFTSLIFHDVKTDKETSEIDGRNQRVISITLESGLIHNILAFEKNGDYWIKIKNSTSTLPTKAASDYIKGSNFLFDGWVFQLAPQVGKLLTGFDLSSDKTYVDLSRQLTTVD